MVISLLVIPIISHHNPPHHVIAALLIIHVIIALLLIHVIAALLAFYIVIIRGVARGAGRGLPPPPLWFPILHYKFEI